MYYTYVYRVSIALYLLVITDKRERESKTCQKTFVNVIKKRYLFLV